MCNGRSFKNTLVSTCNGVVLCDACDRKDLEDNKKINVFGDKWSMKILWMCAIGSAISLYMVAAERQMQNRDRMLAESLKAMESDEGNDEEV